MALLDHKTIKRLAELKTREQELLSQLSPPRLMVEDTTSQKLAALMQQNRDVMASLSADARGAGKVLLGRHNEGSLDEDMYLKAFSSDSSRQDRIGRASTALNDPCLSIAWATQPDLFERLINNTTIAASGLACRFLPLRIDGQAAEPSYEEQSTADSTVTAFDTVINALLSSYHQAASCTTISADIKARQAIEKYSRVIGRRTRSGDLAWIGSFAERWAEISWRIALIFHCVEHGQKSHLTPVTEQTALNALRVMKWFAWHQQQLLERGAERTDNDKLAVAKQFVDRTLGGATPSDVYRSRQTLFDNADDAQNALDQLEHEGAIMSEQSRKGRRYNRKQVPRSR
jgi:replicative DNA helicase